LCGERKKETNRIVYFPLNSGSGVISPSTS
jgi:hypothetical protein